MRCQNAVREELTTLNIENQLTPNKTADSLVLRLLYLSLGETGPLSAKEALEAALSVGKSCSYEFAPKNATNIHLPFLRSEL